MTDELTAARERIGELERITAGDQITKSRYRQQRDAAEARVKMLEGALRYPRFGNTANLLDKAVEQIKSLNERLNAQTGEHYFPLYVNHYENAANDIRAALSDPEVKA